MYYAILHSFLSIFPSFNLIFFFSVLGIKPSALHVLGKHSRTEPPSTPEWLFNDLF